MTITSSNKTITQNDIYAEYMLFQGSANLPNVTSAAVQAYYDISSTPTVADLLTLRDALEEGKNIAINQDSSAPELFYINILENIVGREIANLKIGNPTDNLILTNMNYPLDDLGVTYASLIADLKAVLAVPSNVDTVAHLAAAIFFTVKAANPELSLQQLTTDIQATIDSGVLLSDLVGDILDSLNTINTPSAVAISEAFYGLNIFSAEEANLRNDIQNKELLYNANQIKTNLAAACSNPSTNIAQFAQEIYDSVLVVVGTRYASVSHLTRDVEAGAAKLTNGLVDLKANILENLAAIDPLTTTDALLADAVFNIGCLIPSDPHDLEKDLPPANHLKSLQNILDALIAATNSFNGTATDLGSAILTAVTDAGGGDSLPLAEIVNDINASGNVNALAADINAALSALDVNTLTSDIIVAAIYSNDLIISGHKKNLVDDVTAEQVILNFGDMITDLKTAISNAIDADSLTAAIYNNAGGTLLDQNGLKADVVQSIANLGFGTLQSNLIISLNNADYTTEGVRSALYSAITLISADPYNAATDIAAAETALDYKAMILSLSGVCGQAIGLHPTLTTPLAFANALVNVPQVFGSITATTSAVEIAKDIADDILTGLYPNLGAVALAINNNLNDAYGNYEYNAAAIEAAIFNVINPTDPTRSYNDAVTTENFKSLFDIKSNLLNPCPKVDFVDPSTYQCAQNILTAVANGNVFSTALSVDNLAGDLNATLAALTLPNDWTDTALQYLMNQTTSNLNILVTNALTDTGIVNSMYNTNNGIIDSNPYRMGLDLVAAENYLGILTIKQSLLAYLSDQSSPSVDISAYTLGAGMLNAINISGTDVPSELTNAHLNADISYTVGTDEGDYGQGNYLVAKALFDAITAAQNTDSSIKSAIFSIIAESSDPNNSQDDHYLLNYVDAVNTAATLYYQINEAIVLALQNLPIGYNSQDVADAIVGAIVVPGDRLLSAALLKDNIDATGGTLRNTVATMISNLQNLTDPAQTADDVIAALFAANGGVLADSPADPQALLADVDNSAGLTNDYPAIIDQMVTNLDNPGSLSGYAQWRNFVATSIYNGLNKIADGANGSVSSPMLTQAHIANDVDATCANNVGCVQTLADNIMGGLLALSGAGLSAAGIKGVLFSDTTLHVAQTQADAYNVDLNAAADAHSSLSTIKANFRTAGTYATVSAFVTDLLANIVSETGITTTLTNAQLSNDVQATLNDNNALTLQGLANSVFNGVYTAANTATAMANGMFGSNIQAVYNSDQLYTDIANYYTSRIPTFYQQIADSFIANFATGNVANYDTQSEFANLLVSTVDLTSPDWNNGRVLSDVQASNSNLVALAAALRSAMTGGSLGTYTADNIANNMYNLVLTLSDVDKTALNNDINADVLAYGGANGLAQKVIDALNALPGGYNETQVATAIIQSITPPAFNASPYLSVADMVTDLLYTEGYGPVILTDLVSNLIANLEVLVANPAATADDFDAAIYNNFNGVVPSNDDHVNFERDITNAINNYNNFAVIKAALQGIDTSNANATAASVLSILQLANNTIVEADLADSLSNSVVTTYSDLMAQIASNLASTSVTNIVNAAKLLAYAFYNPNAIISHSEVDFTFDLNSAATVDNAATITGAIGGGMCQDGATHIAYGCTKSNNTLTVGNVIAQNNCTISGSTMAKEACNTWALLGIDHYISLNGETCSDYLNPQEASMQCMSAMDYVAI